MPGSSTGNSRTISWYTSFRRPCSRTSFSRISEEIVISGYRSDSSAGISHRGAGAQAPNRIVRWLRSNAWMRLIMS